MMQALARRRPHRKWQQGSITTSPAWHEGKYVECWIGRFRDYGTMGADGRPTMPRIILGPVGSLSKTKARDLLRAEIQRAAAFAAAAPAHGDPPAPPAKTFRDWWDSWFTQKLATWRGKGSERSVGPLFTLHVLPTIGNIPLAKLTLEHLKQLLNGLTGSLGKSSVAKIRVYLRQTLKEAAAEEVIRRSPAENLPMPAFDVIGAKSLPAPTPDQIRRICSMLDEESALICLILYLTGLRSGELFAARWEDWKGDRLVIDESVYEGQFTTGKNEASRAVVHVPPILSAKIEARRAAAPADPRAFIFSNAVGRPLSQSNFNQRILEPVGKALKIDGLTVRAFRRAAATEAQKHMTVKSTQAHLRHADPATTLRSYVREIPAETRLALAIMEAAVLGVQEPKGKVS